MSVQLNQMLESARRSAATAEAASTLAVANASTPWLLRAFAPQRRATLTHSAMSFSVPYPLVRELAAKSTNQVQHNGDIGLLLAVEAVEVRPIDWT
ncbi:MAG: hypothetical protein U0559_09250 [Anaerolineae bacterium]